MYAKPTCPTPLKILLIVVIAVELVAIGLLLAGRAGASEGGAAALPREVRRPDRRLIRRRLRLPLPTMPPLRVPTGMPPLPTLPPLPSP